MGCVVQKYGGTSVGSVDRIKHVAQRVAKTWKAGHQVAVIVSAMAGETNRLIDLVHEVSPDPSEREYDVIVSTGEQVSIGLLAISTWSADRMWLPFLLGWLTKVMLMKFGTGRMLRQLRLFFIGLILSEASIYCVSTIVGTITDGVVQRF